MLDVEIETKKPRRMNEIPQSNGRTIVVAVASR